MVLRHESDHVRIRRTGMKVGVTSDYGMNEGSLRWERDL